MKTKDKGMLRQPDREFKCTCFVDANFWGFFRW